MFSLFSTIQLNDQHPFQTTKINDTLTDGMLPPEFPSLDLTISNFLPEPLFSIALIPT
jgi:hypothetical protein